MHILKHVSRTIIKKSFTLSVWTIEMFHDIGPYEKKVEQLRQMPVGTLGRDIAECLDANKLRLVPRYESHDLKHVLLDYKMTPVDEIRMQAFMLGNGNYTLPCLAILGFGAILLPAQWPALYKDFVRGRNTKPIASLKIEDCEKLNTKELRELLFTTCLKKQSIFNMKTFTKLGAISSVIAGISGMLFCLPFLFSSALEDLVGAGFPFVAGAILTAGGFLALSNLSKQQILNKYAQ